MGASCLEDEASNSQLQNFFCKCQTGAVKTSLAISLACLIVYGGGRGGTCLPSFDSTYGIRDNVDQHGVSIRALPLATNASLFCYRKVPMVHGSH